MLLFFNFFFFNIYFFTFFSLQNVDKICTVGTLFARSVGLQETTFYFCLALVDEYEFNWKLIQNVVISSNRIFLYDSIFCVIKEHKCFQISPFKYFVLLYRKISWKEKRWLRQSKRHLRLPDDEEDISNMATDDDWIPLHDHQPRAWRVFGRDREDFDPILELCEQRMCCKRDRFS